MKEINMAGVYKKLQERLDMFPQGFPKTNSGVEIQVLQNLFTEEEAEIATFLKPYPEPVIAIAERTDRDAQQLGKLLYDMSKKGLIFRYKESAEVIYYFLTPWVVGIWEFQLKRLNKENIPLYEKFHQEGIVTSAKCRSVGGFRVIPVEQEVKDDREIQPYEKVSEIIEASSKFAVADCICRKESEIMGDKCDKLLEACLSFGVVADYCIENGIAREISKKEAKQILMKAEEDGLVHCSSNHKGEKIFICNCCGCHCKALAYITKHEMPGLIAQSNYFASVDADTCEGCETCTDRCQVNAIEMIDEIAAITLESCIGCGLCVSTCPTGSISMVHKEHEALSHIFADDNDLMQARAKDTGKTFPFD
jgi:Na+-translocating ferredoxin:NAD+ oxidoreductase subunit B